MDLHDSSIRSKIWRISAHDRVNLDQNTSAFSVDVPSLVESFQNVLAIQMISASIPSSFYNVDTFDLDDNVDPTLEFYYNGVFTSLTIPRGQYVIISDRSASPFPANDLLSIIENEFNTVTGSTITFSYDTVKTKLSLTHATNTLEIKQNNIDNNLWYKLGFLKTQGPTTTIVADSLPNLSGVQQLFIHINQLSNNSIDLDRENGISLVGSVLVTAPYGAFNNYEIKSSSANMIKYNNKRDISFLDVRLRDSRGRLINLNNQDWHVIVKSYYTKD